MPRNDDFDDDDRPRRRPRDEDDDRMERSRRRRHDEEDRDRPPPRKKSNVGLILGIVFGVLFLLCGGGGLLMYFAFKGAVNKVTDAADRMASNNNMKEIGLAVITYETEKHDYPSNSYGPDGKPLLSWRVHILPYLGPDGDALYKQFKLDEPWDSPNNRRLLDQMPAVYGTPAERNGRAPKGNKTYYRGFAGAGGVFSRRDPAAKGKPGADQPPGKVTVLDFKHGMSNTPIVVEAGESVEWTNPDDLDLSPGKPFPSLGGIRPKDDTIQVLFADGSVRAVRRTVSEAQWRTAVNVAGLTTANLD
jgi:Protein of unknown function (DUF1559)